MRNTEEPGPGKPSVNVYTAMLLLAFVAISIGCLMMVLNLAQYDFVIQPDL